MHPTQHSIHLRRSAEKAALPPTTPTHPPAPDRILSVMADNLQRLARKNHQALHLEPDTDAHGEFQPSTKAALSTAMKRALQRPGPNLPTAA